MVTCPAPKVKESSYRFAFCSKAMDAYQALPASERRARRPCITCKRLLCWVSGCALCALTVPIFLLTWLTAVRGSPLQCPSYGALRTSSVEPNRFNISKYDGVWYLMATNEPFLPPGFVCALTRVWVRSEFYFYTMKGVGTGPSSAFVGAFSHDPASPGLLYENIDFTPIDILKKVSQPKKFPRLVPNMIFNVTYASGPGADSKDIVLTNNYACIGENGSAFGWPGALVDALLGRQLFAYYLYSRHPNMSREEIQTHISWARATGLLDLEDVTIFPREVFVEAPPNGCAGISF